MAYTTILIMGALFSLLGILFPRVLCGVFIDMNEGLGVIADLGVRAYYYFFIPPNFFATFFEKNQFFFILKVPNVCLYPFLLMLTTR